MGKSFSFLLGIIENTLGELGGEKTRCTPLPSALKWAINSDGRI